MSLPESGLSNPQRGMLVEKPRFSVYTMMLVLSLLATLVACLFLYAEMSAYNFDMWAKGAR